MRNWFALVLVLATVGACGRPRGDAAAAAAVATQAAKTGTAVTYVDVRSAEEWAQGHVAGAIHIPVEQMPERWTELAALKDKPVVLYCQSGGRAAAALQVLQQHGFTAAVNGGGLAGLQAQGVAVSQ
jgi:phage shock protein E